MIVSFQGKTPQVAPTAFVHPLAYVVGDVVLEDHVTILPFASIRGEYERIVIRAYSNVQDNCSVHADPGQPMEIGPSVSIGHNATIHCRRIGAHTLVGMGATIVQHCEVGEWCLVAAGAVLAQGVIVPDRSLVVGVPARVTPLPDKHLERLQRQGQSYVRLGASYRNGESSLPLEPPARDNE
ncbi:MAG: gamma carbonic anhydrase family protein [Dehalococcoidia bacterium]|nr:gamma carbonic anhydrase family protein [Dehalococcoidia bacterium]